MASYIVAHSEENSKESILPSSYSNIADMLGTTYRHISRTLKDMCEEGIIKKSGNRITVTDKKKLESLADSIYNL